MRETERQAGLYRHYLGRARRDGRLLLAVMTDARVPWYSRLPAAVGAIYIASPIDFIPDLVPGFGWLDDLVVIVVAAALCVRLLPRAITEEIRATCVTVAPEAKALGAAKTGTSAANAWHVYAPFYVMVIIGALMAAAAIALAYIQPD
jgi:uncharacterized membrane protein YkvA (DUF1232 family)